MTLLNEILSEIESHSFDMQVKMLCDRIQEEENEKMDEELFNKLPKGPNIFLSLPVKGRFDNEVGFLCLERESKDKYIISNYSMLKKHLNKKDEHAKRVAVWQITNDENIPKKILVEYAKQFKFLNNEM